MDEVVAAELKRIRDEDDRQNHRIDQLEQTVEKLNELMLTIQRLAMSVESLTKEVGRQGDRLEAIEKAPIKRLDSARQTVINTVIGIIIGALAAGLIQVVASNLR